MIEITTGLLFLFSDLNTSENELIKISSFAFVSFLILLVVADLKWKMLPHPFTNIFALGGFVFQGVDKIFNLTSFYVVASGFVIVGAIIFTLTQIFPEVLGGGDIKMMLALSVWLGVAKSSYVLVLAFVMGAFVALILLALKKINGKSTMPFGPFLALGACVMWFCPEMLDYLRMAL